MAYAAKLGLLVLAFYTAIGCRVERPSPPVRTLLLSELSDADQVNEAIFRSAGLSGIGPTKVTSSYYLAVDEDRDPSDELMEYLNRGGTYLKKFSRSYISTNETGIVRDLYTNKEGKRFTISKLNWKGSGNVTAKAGYYAGNMEGEWCTYILVRENGEWQIASKEQCVVS